MFRVYEKLPKVVIENGNKLGYVESREGDYVTFKKKAYHGLDITLKFKVIDEDKYKLEVLLVDVKKESQNFIAGTKFIKTLLSMDWGLAINLNHHDIFVTPHDSRTARLTVQCNYNPQVNSLRRFLRS